VITGLCPFCSHDSILVTDGNIHDKGQVMYQSYCNCGFSTPWRKTTSEVRKDMRWIMSAVALKEDKRCVRSGKQKATSERDA